MKLEFTDEFKAEASQLCSLFGWTYYRYLDVIQIETDECELIADEIHAVLENGCWWLPLNHYEDSVNLGGVHLFSCGAVIDKSYIKNFDDYWRYRLSKVEKNAKK